MLFHGQGICDGGSVVNINCGQVLTDVPADLELISAAVRGCALQNTRKVHTYFVLPSPADKCIVLKLLFSVMAKEAEP